MDLLRYVSALIGHLKNNNYSLAFGDIVDILNLIRGGMFPPVRVNMARGACCDDLTVEELTAKLDALVQEQHSTMQAAAGLPDLLVPILLALLKKFLGL